MLINSIVKFKKSLPYLRMIQNDLARSPVTFLHIIVSKKCEKRGILEKKTRYFLDLIFERMIKLPPSYIHTDYGHF